LCHFSQTRRPSRAAMATPSPPDVMVGLVPTIHAFAGGERANG
jgi:hypothetical protein